MGNIVTISSAFFYLQDVEKKNAEIYEREMSEVHGNMEA
jgi:hypothetical protein